MPEGDSIHRVAAWLRPTLVGQPLRRLYLRDKGEVPSVNGCTIERIDVVGKHMLVAIQGGLVLRVHLGMYGRWRSLRRPGVRRPDAVIILETDRSGYACFKAPVAELRRADDIGLRRRLARLGPDLLAASCDLEVVFARARDPRHRDRMLGELLLDQSVAAGIGNVYKSEILFTQRVHPDTKVGSVDDETLRNIFGEARRMMLGNLGPGPRTTTTTMTGVRRPAEVARHFVYRRHGLPCFRCRATIERTLQGDAARSTYWCPRCQPRPD